MNIDPILSCLLSFRTLPYVVWLNSLHFVLAFELKLICLICFFVFQLRAIERKLIWFRVNYEAKYSIPIFVQFSYDYLFGGGEPVGRGRFWGWFSQK